MSSVNMVILVGNLTADPEVRFAPDGKAITTLRLATNKRFKDRDGVTQEKAEFHRVVFFGKAGETLGEHARKGSLLFVEGELSTRKWTDKKEVVHYSTEIVGGRFQFLGGGKREPDAGDAPAGSVREAARASVPAAAVPAGGGAFDDMADDIPF